MSYYPETPVPQYPLIISPRWRTTINSMDTGVEERTKKWVFAQYDVVVQYNALSSTDVKTIWDFYMAREGAYEAFYIYDLSLIAGMNKTHTKQYVGTGDGSTVTWSLPGRSLSSQIVSANNVVVDSGDYTITPTTGGTVPDSITFDTAPDTGDIITITFSGYLRIRCRFAEDSMPFELFTTTLTNVGVSLKGLAPL